MINRDPDALLIARREKGQEEFSFKNLGSFSSKFLSGRIEYYTFMISVDLGNLKNVEENTFRDKLLLCMKAHSYSLSLSLSLSLSISISFPFSLSLHWTIRGCLVGDTSSTEESKLTRVNCTKKKCTPYGTRCPEVNTWCPFQWIVRILVPCDTKSPFITAKHLRSWDSYCNIGSSNYTLLFLQVNKK